MGGHGGLNILPQKRWNVYNFDNREKVRKDEEAAAKEEQLKREQSRKRDAEFRLEQLRRARGINSSSAPRPSSPSQFPDTGHINLFQGIEGFSALVSAQPDAKEREVKEDRSGKRRREERPVTVAPEDEKYRMGYGVAGKGVKAPWYLAKPSSVASGEDEEREGVKEKRKESGKKKTIQELREERLKREKREKERERALKASSGRERHRSPSGSHRSRGSQFR